MEGIKNPRSPEERKRERVAQNRTDAHSRTRTHSTETESLPGRGEERKGRRAWGAVPGTAGVGTRGGEVPYCGTLQVFGGTQLRPLSRLSGRVTTSTSTTYSRPRRTPASPRGGGRYVRRARGRTARTVTITRPRALSPLRRASRARRKATVASRLASPPRGSDPSRFRSSTLHPLHPRWTNRQRTTKRTDGRRQGGTGLEG